ncbi:RNA ligase, Rnl2 family [Chryseobacterium indologenes]|uniref:RNA ligase, Rnl2 family n=1 Tax=Chryseobacterium indologenes TaxID=253 RepID=UPI000F4F9E24|nr:RNA ligase, Rnl2 family [Chryseobacterium indologenes]AYZ37107.1 RNA ligase, Rnl2 family [Chryseobacterium indologenes]MBF6645953.1 RNA ligase, Rnl2 family [Chryseobacterium indologenes]MBU3048476.1 RNA ligase, Rnl2 family [Chryseobacterium indologenes]MEB4761000.1 RNA ligase, Rnl2 family [Chryseobacterium indologenes]QQQ70384.1 RNA ligase, Rnl2 family [Chryseobacterium indologenes]
MIFKTYNSIENAYQTHVIEQIRLQGFGDEVFIVQEKVHGANFSFFTDGKEIKIAKRTAFIGNDEKFFNAHQILERYRKNVVEVFHAVKKLYRDVQTIVIYGELFGGGYKHKDVEAVKDAVRVQKGIEYAPYNEFYAFDIKLNGVTYLDTDIINIIFEKTGFFYAKTLFQGTLEEALKFPNVFNSKIPAWLGLPELNNMCEGTIVKTLKTRYFGNGGRVILKNKNEKWIEKSKMVKKQAKIAQKPIDFSEQAQNIWEEIQQYVTANRLNNVLSKTGEFEPKMIGKVIGLFAQDVLEDFEKDFPAAFATIEKEEQKRINKKLNSIVIDCVKEELMTLKI